MSILISRIINGKRHWTVGRWNPYRRTVESIFWKELGDGVR